MRALFIKSMMALGFLFVTNTGTAQCDIQHRIYPDGSMFYYIEPVNFYWTQSKDLKGGVTTDKENYYLSLQPSPFPPKPAGHKLKDDVELKLANDSVYILEHFDTRYIEKDTVMEMMFLIEKACLKDLQDFEAISVKLNMGGDEGIRTYIFKLHKSALMEQLVCFLDENKGINTKR